MKDWEILLRDGLNRIGGKKPEFSQEIIPWETIARRYESMFENPDAVEHECGLVAVLLRDHFERERGVDPNTLSFKSVRNDDGEVWHVWLEQSGKIVDRPDFRNQYSRLYAMGKPDAAYEAGYQEMKKKGMFGE